MSFPTDKPYPRPSTPEGATIHHLLPQKLLAAITGKSWKFSRLVSGGESTLRGGRHKSQRHDGYMPIEFSQHRQYASGDEIRHIDWKIFARKEKFFIKQFRSESSISAYIVLDASASMGYPFKTSHNENEKSTLGVGEFRPLRADKFFYATQVAAACAYILVSQGDSVGLLVSGGKFPTKTIPPSGGWAHFEGAITPCLIEGISEEISPETGGMFEAAKVFGGLLSEIKKRSLVIFISDLMGSRDEIASAIKLMASQRHECAVIQVLHPDEMELAGIISRSGAADATAAEIIDSETREVVEVTPEMIDEYKKRISEEISFYRSLESHGRGLISYHTFLTHTPIEKNFLKLVE